MVARNALLASLAASAAARASCASLEQPRVLDRDHRLVGEGLEQRDLLVAERLAAAGATTQIGRCRGPPRASARRRPSSCPISSATLAQRAPARRRRRSTSGTWSDAPLADRRCAGERLVERLGKRVARRRRAPTPRHAADMHAARRRRAGRCRAARCANRRWQLSRILSNTGAVSATELLMTCSTSAVAVCCSSASCVSLNSRTFSIAITAWSAKVCSSAISCRRERPAPRRAAARSRRCARLRAAAARRAPCESRSARCSSRTSRVLGVDQRQDVLDVHDAALEDRAAADRGRARAAAVRRRAHRA